MSRGNDLDKDLERLLAEAERGGVSQPRRSPADQSVPVPPPPPRPAITPADPAVQIVESAHQIVTMIGANPRAIRPILAQRRLTKEQVLSAAANVAERTATALAEIEAAEADRQAVHEAAILQLKDQIEAEQAEALLVVEQEDLILAECDAARGRIGRIQARFGIAELPAVAPPQEEAEERPGFFGRIVEELTDNRVVGAFVRVRRGDGATPEAKPDGRILRADDPTMMAARNMDDFVQATDASLPQAALFRMWCELAGVTDAEVRATLAAVQDLVARQVAQSSEVKRQNDEAHRAEMARLQGQMDAANAAWSRFQAEQRGQRTFLGGLCDRAATVAEVYNAL